MRNIFLQILFTIIAFVGFNSCANETSLWTGKRVHEVHISFAERNTRVSLTPSANSGDMIAKWQDGDQIHVILSHGSETYDLGNVPVRNISEDGKTGVFQYALPEELKDVEYYELSCFTENCQPKIVDGNILYQASIVRKPIKDFKARVMFDQVVTYEEPLGLFGHYGTYELLHIKNKSDKSISFSLNDFSADLRWYKQSGAIRLFDKQFVTDLSLERIEKSPATTIPANTSDIIVSWYIPNGQKISDATLVAEIDGKNVKSSNTISSGVTLCTGIAYHMYATWDGTELKFEKGDVTAESTIIVEPTEIDFGEVTIGETKKENLTIINSGEEQKEVKVAIEGHGPYDGPFELPDAHLWDDYVTKVIPAGESSTVVISFRALAAEEYSGNLVVTSDGIQDGSCIIPIKAKGVEEDKSFHLSDNSIEVYVNTEKVVDIKNGSGEYDVVNENPDIVDYDINGMHVTHARRRTPTEEERDKKNDHWWITAKKIGNATLKLTDKQTKKTLTLEVKVTQAPSLTLAKNDIELQVGKTEKVEILTGSEWYEITTDNPSVVSASKATISTGGGGGRDGGGTSHTGIYAVIEALAEGNAIVIVKDISSGETAKIKVTVGSGGIVSYLSCPDDNHPHAIDLGLPSGSKWACCNVGASKPEGYGGYYAWGEIEVKDEYSTENYTYRNEQDRGKDISGTEHDVAHVKWGDYWCMPSLDEVKEFLDNCTSEWVNINGVDGRLFTSHNGERIFLPAAGECWDSSHREEGSHGSYWSSTDGPYAGYFACALEFGKSSAYWKDGLARRVGKSVRPVIKSTSKPDHTDGGNPSDGGGGGSGPDTDNQGDL